MKANTSPYFKPKKHKVTLLDGSNCLYSTILTSRPPLPSSWGKSKDMPKEDFQFLALCIANLKAKTSFFKWVFLHYIYCCSESWIQELKIWSPTLSLFIHKNNENRSVAKKYWYIQEIRNTKRLIIVKSIAGVSPSRWSEPYKTQADLITCLCHYRTLHVPDRVDSKCSFTK